MSHRLLCSGTLLDHSQLDVPMLVGDGRPTLFGIVDRQRWTFDSTEAVERYEAGFRAALCLAVMDV